MVEILSVQENDRENLALTDKSLTSQSEHFWKEGLSQSSKVRVRSGGCKSRQGSCLLLISKVIHQENNMERVMMDLLSFHPESQPPSKIDELISQCTGYKGPWRSHPCTEPAVPLSSLTRLVWSGTCSTVNPTAPLGMWLSTTLSWERLLLTSPNPT